MHGGFLAIAQHAALELPKVSRLSVSGETGSLTCHRIHPSLKSGAGLDAGLGLE